MHSYRAECMGTGFIFQIEDQAEPEKLDALCDSALEVLEDANQRFSLYMDNSEISRLNRGELDWSRASYQQQQIREKVVAWQEKTTGYFNAKVGGSEYDPSGIVKAWATQNAADFLLANGVRGFTINAGGDIYLSPELESPGLNRVGLSNLKSVASEGSGANLVLDLFSSSFRAVATSGISERCEH
ncbi:MAG: FAD:protein FMN transferase, partial [Aquiluna sp.]